MTKSAQELIESFYRDVWNQRDYDVAYDIIAEDFRFRGSLGSEKRGIEGFIEYVEAVHTALGNYTCVVKDLVCANDRAAAKMAFQGVHQADFFGVKSTNKQIEWVGAAFFTVADSKLSELWVLGDVDSVKQQLGASTDQYF